MLQTMIRLLPVALDVVASLYILAVAWDWFRVRPMIYQPYRLDVYPINWPRLLSAAAFVAVGLGAIWS